MNNPLIFNFTNDISGIEIPNHLNNPFDSSIPQLAKIAALEFQDFIEIESKNWDYDFDNHKGKMFGVLVVEHSNNKIGYQGTVSGKFPGTKASPRFIPSIFNDSVDDYFINKGMAELKVFSNKIRKSSTPNEITELKEKRKQKSLALQHQLFQHYRFLNVNGEEQNVLEIFEDRNNTKPPSAAGECAAPKLLQYAFKHKLKPIALAEFFWGHSPINKDREHKIFYPACKEKCRPILEYMLNDSTLFEQVT